jgi:FkbM family methyltransferase
MNSLYTNNSLVDSCGVCSSCESVVEKSESGQVRVVAVEMMKKTAEMLNATFNQFNVPWMVVHAAASDDDGYAYEPAELPVGVEEFGIQRDGRPVPQFKLDTLARRLNVDTIDFLHIDTEGYDPLVLKGAASLLQSQQVRVLEFEYHGKGPWLGTLMRDAIDQLRAYGYTCFFEGSSGALTPLLPQCGLLYEFHRWSNLVCSHDQSVLSVLKSFVPPFLNA